MLNRHFPIILATSVLSACGGEATSTPKDTEIKSSSKDGKNSSESEFYSAPIINTSGEEIGTLTLKPNRHGTEANLVVRGLSAGERAMHFHEFGRCDGPDFKSAGGHYNPKGTKHGMDMEGGPHAGDMMNITFSGAPSSSVNLVNSRVSINGESDRPPLFDADGSALIIHERADDNVSQPSGAAGARIACAVIKPKAD